MKLSNIVLLVFLITHLACQKTPETDLEKRKAETVTSLPEDLSLKNNNISQNSIETKKLILRQIALIGDAKSSNAALERPMHLTIDQDGNIYVLDNLAQNIQKYSLNGKLISIFGRKGDGPGEFKNLHALDYLNDKLYAYDEGNLRITVFDTAGKILNEYSMHTYFKDGLDIKKFLAAYDTSVAFIKIKSEPAERLVKSAIFFANQKFSSYRKFIEVSVPMQGYVVGGAQGGFVHYHNNVLLTADKHYWITPSPHYEIDCFLPDGKIMKTIKRPSLQQRYSQHEREAVRKFKVTLYGQVFHMELPEFKQDIEDLISDSQDRIWVMTSKRDLELRNHFDVFDVDSNFLFQVWGQLNEPKQIHFYKDFMITLHRPDNAYPFIRILNYSLEAI